MYAFTSKLLSLLFCLLMLFFVWNLLPARFLGTLLLVFSLLGVYSFLYLNLTLVPCQSFVVTILLCVGLFIVGTAYNTGSY